MSLSSQIAQAYLFGNGNTARKEPINKQDTADHQEDKIRVDSGRR